MGEPLQFDLLICAAFHEVVCEHQQVTNPLRQLLELEYTYVSEQ